MATSSRPASHVSGRSGLVARLVGLSAFGFLAFTGVLVYATTGEVGRLTRAFTPTPREVAHDLFVRGAEDRAGRRASFRILLFSDEFRWKLASSDALEHQGPNPEFTDAMRAVLNSAQEVICVGTSSEEVTRGVSTEEGETREEIRAARRAERIATWVRRLLSRPVPVRKLNVGHHSVTRAADTSDQRRMVIILVMEHDADANIDQALRNAMARESVRAPIFETLLTSYSLSAGRAFTWVK